MVRNAIALAVASMISLSGPALAADAKASATKASVTKADTIQRAAASQRSADRADGDNTDLLVYGVFGVVTVAITVAAFSNDKKAASE